MAVLRKAFAVAIVMIFSALLACMGNSGDRAQVTLKSGATYTGTIVAETDVDISLVAEPDGIKVTIPKSMVAEIKLLPVSTPQGEEPEKDKQDLSPILGRKPEDYLHIEAIVGTLGAAVGGWLGFNLGRDVFCMHPEKEFKPGSCMEPMVSGLMSGLLLGAVAGVSLTGSYLGVKGNIFLAQGGALAGGMMGLGAAASLSLIDPEIRLPASLVLALVALGSGYGAAYGFNEGATFEEIAP